MLDSKSDVCSYLSQLNMTLCLKEVLTAELTMTAVLIHERKWYQLLLNCRVIVSLFLKNTHKISLIMVLKPTEITHNNLNMQSYLAGTGMSIWDS
jgi:hypothetical protein